MANVYRLFNDIPSSDFRIKCGDRDFYVHKLILQSRSDYFRGLFRADSIVSCSLQFRLQPQT